MTRPTTDPLTGNPAQPDATPRVATASPTDGRLAGLTLIAGCALATLGFLGVSFAVRATGDARFTDPLWQPLYGVLLAGSVLVVLGLPAVLAAHGSASRRLTLIGYVAMFAPLVMLNVAETSIEAFVKPYLVGHGGLPAQDPAGLGVFEMVALLLLIVGCVSLAVAVFRGRVLHWWVGVALIASVVTAFVLPHDGALAFVSDYCVYAALIAFGLRAARRR
jgi:hypothetical protein